MRSTSARGVRFSVWPSSLAHPTVKTKAKPLDIGANEWHYPQCHFATQGRRIGAAEGK